MSKEKIEEKRNVKENILNISTLIFLFLIPLFSTTYFYSSYTTLFEVVIIFVIFFATLIIYKDSRKNSKYLFIYYALCFLYLIISFLRSDTFYSLVPGNFNYNFLDEGLTIIKLITPITLIYSLYYQKIE